MGYVTSELAIRTGHAADKGDLQERSERVRILLEDFVATAARLLEQVANSPA
jgi:hypothetical protein